MNALSKIHKAFNINPLYHFILVVEVISVIFVSKSRELQKAEDR